MDLDYHNSPYLIVENPYVGPSSEMGIHQDEANLWNAPLPSTRQLAINEDIKYNIKNDTTLRLVATRFKCSIKDLSYGNIIGRRILVNWTAKQGAAGKWPGTIIDYEPLMHKYWIRYDIPDANKDTDFPQDLVNKLKTWRFLN
jgi:hypothetical protein